MGKRARKRAGMEFGKVEVKGGEWRWLAELSDAERAGSDAILAQKTETMERLAELRDRLAGWIEAPDFLAETTQ